MWMRGVDESNGRRVGAASRVDEEKVGVVGTCTSVRHLNSFRKVQLRSHYFVTFNQGERYVTYFCNRSADWCSEGYAGYLFLRFFHANLRHLVIMFEVAVAQRTSCIAGKEHLVSDWIINWGFVRECKRVVGCNFMDGRIGSKNSEKGWVKDLEERRLSGCWVKEF
jgi:hypothetical protein